MLDAGKGQQELAVRGLHNKVCRVRPQPHKYGLKTMQYLRHPSIGKRCADKGCDLPVRRLGIIIQKLQRVRRYELAAVECCVERFKIGVKLFGEHAVQATRNVSS